MSKRLQQDLLLTSALLVIGVAGITPATIVYPCFLEVGIVLHGRKRYTALVLKK